MTGYFHGRKVLVAGGAGFIGTNLIQRLLPTGAEITATIHRTEPPFRASGVTYRRCDLRKMEDCREAVAGMDYVFLCAASTHGAAMVASDPLAHVTPNIVINAQTLEAAYRAGVKKLLYLSSSTVYPDTGRRPVREEEMMAGEPFGKYIPVGWMKRYSEILCRLYSRDLEKTMPVVVIRPTNVYGEYDKTDFAASHVLPALIRKVVERHDPIEVWGSGEDVRDLIYVGDFVEAMLLAMEKIETYDPINVGRGEGHSVIEILNLTLEIDGYQRARVVLNPDKPTTIPVRLVDTARAERLLGFRARTGLAEGLRKTIAWYRSTLRVGDR